MSDLIYRQAAIDAIGDIHPLDYNARAIKARIEQLPVIEVVLCRECRHWDTNKNCGYCYIWDYYISNESFYCGCGERRSEEDGN